MMIFLPVLLSILGLFLGPVVAKKLDNCPHRGKVWGAFSVPLLSLFYSPLQLHAVAVSLFAAISAGTTAHADFKKTLVAVLLSCAGATLLVEQLL